MSKGGTGSHWVGCEEAHHDCCLRKLREAEAENVRLNRECNDLTIANIDLTNEVERLKCCGNCDAFTIAQRQGHCIREATVAIDRWCNSHDHCHFTPSRWQPREESK